MPTITSIFWFFFLTSSGQRWARNLYLLSFLNRCWETRVPCVERASRLCRCRRRRDQMDRWGRQPWWVSARRASCFLLSTSDCELTMKRFCTSGRTRRIQAARRSTHVATRWRGAKEGRGCRIRPCVRSHSGKFLCGERDTRECATKSDGAVLYHGRSLQCDTKRPFFSETFVSSKTFFS